MSNGKDTTNNWVESPIKSVEWAPPSQPKCNIVEKRPPIAKASNGTEQLAKQIPRTLAETGMPASSCSAVRLDNDQSLVDNTQTPQPPVQRKEPLPLQSLHSTNAGEIRTALRYESLPRILS